MFFKNIGWKPFSFGEYQKLSTSTKNLTNPTPHLNPLCPETLRSCSILGKTELGYWIRILVKSAWRIFNIKQFKTMLLSLGFREVVHLNIYHNVRTLANNTKVTGVTLKDNQLHCKWSQRPKSWNMNSALKKFKIQNNPWKEEGK